MNAFEGLVLFSVLWFLVFFIVLAIPGKTQQQSGEVVPGTPASAPQALNLRRRVLITTAVAVVLFAGIASVILSGAITVRDLDMFHRMGPPPAGGTGG